MEIYLKTKKILGESNIANQNWGEKKNKQKTQQQQQKKPKTTKASTENWFKCIKEFSINSSPATCNYLRPFNPQHQEILLD